ncbi:amino acid deaminase [Dactylosporangium fulvum]|uniref:Alanine racemase n=1 Tax=Dactylosporangium fulvum TaxID=53359 RepID=A0ABY5WB82_9ACTN|nr:alanine racemase [Dactylosporangium fulvum]UWP86494.1 alanine racemase [Dactylosporangium fulvum]
MDLDWRTKGFWLPDAATDVATFAAAGHSLFDGGFTWPLLVARRSAVEHNLRTMVAFCARRGLAFAPHVKTTMAPKLIAAQLDAGAWGVTTATANQALICRNLGVPRVLLANQLLDPTVLRWAARQAQDGFDLLFQVDSRQGVRAAAGLPLRVLVELGHPGGRTGCRTVEELLAVARAVDAAPGLTLAGVAAYEGGLPGLEQVLAFLDGLRGAVAALAGHGLLGPEVVVATGGSAWFDLVADRLAGQWLPGRAVRLVLRSGAYVSHDDGFYRERTPFNRLGGERLRPALEIWAQVLSTPEPGLAIVGMGKRDVSFDEGLPEPAAVRRADGTVVPAVGMTVTRVNDHHGYLSTGGVEVEPGDLVRFGISHPCTAFDKWRAIPYIDDDGMVTDVLQTCF